MRANWITGSVIGLAVAGIAYAITGRQRVS